MTKKAKIYLVLTIFIVLGGIAVLIAWSVDKPNNPSFSIDQASINDYNLTADNRLNATFTLVIKSHNRDSKYTIKYRNILVAIFHDTYSLANLPNVGMYTQHHGEDLVFTAQPVARNFTVLDDEVVTGLRNEAKVGELTFEVRIRAYVKFVVKGWKHKRYTLGIICSPLLIDLGSGKLVHGTNCNVDRF